VLLALAAVVLLALVAVGSLRDRPGAGGGTPHFPSTLVQTLALLSYLALLAGAIVAVWTLLPDRARAVRRARNPLVGPLMVLLTVLALALARSQGWLDALRLPGLRPLDPLTAQPTAPTVPAQRLPGSGPRWLPFAIVGALLLGVAVATVVRARLARRRRAALAQPGELAEVLDHALDELEQEADPRRAVIAAWIRMERGLAAAGLPRHLAEAPLEYATRVLERAAARPDSVRRLADLFEQAKFSRHTIDEGMRRAAVEALTAIREQLEVEQASLEQASLEQASLERAAGPPEVAG
jgi:hypothetical protein